MADAQGRCDDTQQYLGQPGVLHVEVDGCRLLCMEQTGVLRPIVPTALRRAVLNSVHGLAHAGIRATRRIITSRYVWHACSADITACCRDCQDWARSKAGRIERAVVQPIPVPRDRFSHVHVDLVGPLPATQSGCTHVLTAVDRTTRWPEVIPLTGITAHQVADAFVSAWVARFGVPAVVTTDRGPQFSSAVWSCLCRTLGMQHIQTTAYHPQSNGLVERFHRQLKEALKARNCGAAWEEHLPWVLLGIRAAPKDEAGISAFSAAAALWSRLGLGGLAEAPHRHAAVGDRVVCGQRGRGLVLVAASWSRSLAGAPVAVL